MIDPKDAQLNGISNRKKRPRRIQEKWDTLAIFKEDKLVLMKFNNPEFNLSETDITDKNQNYIKMEIEDINSNIETNVCGLHKYFVDSINVESKNFYSGVVDSFRESFKNRHKLKSEYWELAAQGEQETPLQKYYRLKFEIEDLLTHKSNFQIVKENYVNEKLRVNMGYQVQNILNKLYIYSIDGQFKLLERFETSEIFNSRNYITKKLLEKCRIDKEQFININNIFKVLNIEVTSKDLKPNTLNIVQLHQISRLEDRLQKLEVIIGSEKSILVRLAISNYSDGLVEAVCKLSGLSNQILPHIHVIEPKVVYLLPKLKQITSNLLDKSLEVDKKTNELFKIILRSREESNLLTHVIQRMNILDIFRHQVETLAVTMNNLSTQYSETSKTLKNNELLLNNIETHIPKHLDSVLPNLQSLNARIKVLADQLKNIEV